MGFRPPLGIGIIGCGTISHGVHLRTLAGFRDVTIAGLADPDPDALTRAAQRVDAPLYSDPAGLLASKGVDAVVISSPAGLHAEHFVAARSAGKHVYLEKPLAHDGPALSAISDGIAEAELVLAVGFNYRFHPACQQLRRRLIEGSIGEVRAIFSDFCEPVDVSSMPGWKRERRLGGGVLLDLASHHIDLYRWFLQDELADITADQRSLFSDQDSACVRATTQGGVELCGYFAFTSSRSHGLTFHGTKGVLHLDMHAGVITEITNRRLRYGVRKRTVAGGAADLGWRIRRLVQPSYNPSHKLALRAFVNGVFAPAQQHADLATVQDGAASLQAVLGAEASAGSEAIMPTADHVPT